MRLQLGVIALLDAGMISSAAREAVADALVEPKILIVDSSMPKGTRDAEILAARRYDTFWNTGDSTLVDLALAEGFIDETPSPGPFAGAKGSACRLERVSHGSLRSHLHGRADDRVG